MKLNRAGMSLMLGAALLAACSRVPTRPSEPGASRPQYTINDPAAFPRNAEAVSGPAVIKLLRQARIEMSSGKGDQAVATLETAINIEPRNAFVWEALAQAHLARNLPEEAEHVAIRSNSFARGNPWVEAGNWRTIAQSRTRRGDTPGAQEASDHYEALAARLAR